MGWLGVDLFFALSGFLIVSILMRDHSLPKLNGFFKKRFVRIVPIYVVSIVAFFLASWFLGADTEELHQLWMTLLFLTGWVIPFLGLDAVPFTITWSLSVEVTAYLMLGCAAFGGQVWIRRIVITLVVLPLAVRLLVLIVEMFNPGLLYVFVPGRLDSIALGGVAALLASRLDLSGTRSIVLIGGAVLIVMIGLQWTPIDGLFLPSVGYSLFGVIAAMLVLSLHQNPVQRAGWTLRALASIGRVSYFIYLFHIFVLDALVLFQTRVGVGEAPFWLAVPMSLLIVYGLALLSWKWFESPLIARAHNTHLESSPQTTVTRSVKITGQ